MKKFALLFTVFLSACGQKTYQQKLEKKFYDDFSGIYSLNENCHSKEDRNEEISVSKSEIIFGNLICQTEYFDKLKELGDTSVNFRECYIQDVEMETSPVVFKLVDEAKIEIKFLKDNQIYNAYRCDN